MSKVLVLGGGDYKRLWEDEGYDVETKEFTDDIELVCFTGGSDINPRIYGSRVSPFTMRPDVSRDTREVDIFKKAWRENIPMVGICRGAQLICAQSGGQLFQHVCNHDSAHKMMTAFGEEMVVTSSHHQMMDIKPLLNAEVKPVVLGWSSEKRSHYYYDGDGIVNSDEPEKELEVVYFPEHRALAHQPHPEWMKSDSPYRQFFFNTVHEYLGV